MDKFVNEIICGDVSDVLRQIPSDFVDCVVTSPPYWALRDYGIKSQIWDGDGNCKHEWERGRKTLKHKSGETNPGKEGWYKDKRASDDKGHSFCLKCGAWRGSLGLEPNFELYIKHLCDIFDEVKRVLKDEGTCWVNLGDTYSGSCQGAGKNTKERVEGKKIENLGSSINYLQKYGHTLTLKPPSAKTSVPDKSLCMIPFRFVIEMVNRGWILRNTIIWHKPNCMPSSVKDRFTVDFEYVFFFVKSKRYWFEQIFEPHLTHKHKTIGGEKYKEIYNRKKETGFININPQGRNKRCVWAINDKRKDYLVLKLYEIKRQIRGQSSYQGKSTEQKNWNEALNNAKAFREGLRVLQQEENLTDEELCFLKDYVQNHVGSPQGRNKRCVWTIKENHDFWTKILTERAVGGAQRETLKFWLEWIEKNPEGTYEDFYKEFSSKKVSKYQDMKWQRGINNKDTAWGNYSSYLSLPNPLGNKKGCTWKISTKSFKGAHFATFPPDLVEPMIRSGCPEFVCKKCGKARKKIFNTTTTYLPYKHPAGKQPGKIFSVNAPRWESKTNFIGYTDCGCDAGFNPGIVLDPFSGSGTTLTVAKSLGRNYIGIDLNHEYIKMAQRRITKLDEDRKSETKR